MFIIVCFFYVSYFRLLCRLQFSMGERSTRSKQPFYQTLLQGKLCKLLRDRNNHINWSKTCKRYLLQPFTFVLKYFDFPFFTFFISRAVQTGLSSRYRSAHLEYATCTSNKGGGSFTRSSVTHPIRPESPLKKLISLFGLCLNSSMPK